MAVTVSKGLVFLPAQGGPSTGFYLLDTGCPSCVFDKTAFALSEKAGKDGVIDKGIFIKENQYPGAPFSRHDITSFQRFDLGPVSAQVDVKVIAVVGEPAFRSHVMQIDYANHRVRDVPRDQVATERLGQKWTLIEENGAIYTTIKVNGTHSCKLRIDTGGAGFIRIDPEEKPNFGWRHGASEGKNKLVTVYGILQGAYFEPDELDVNGTKFRHPRIDVNVDPSHNLAGSSLGGGFLSSYLVTIDVAGGAMYLKPAPAAPASTAPSH